MIVKVNGEARDCAAKNIAGLVESLGLPSAAVLVEHNGTALRRDEWLSRTLSDGDVIEVVRIVAGG